MKKLTKSFIGGLLLILVACMFFVITKSILPASAAGAPVIEIVCTPKEIKSNAAGATIQVTPTVKGNTDTVYAAQISVNFDTTYFEYSGFTASNEVLKSRLDTNQSDLANGVAVVFAEDDVTGITKANWKMGTVILKVKNGAVLPAGSSSAITCTDSLLGGDDEIAHTVTNASIPINFVSPSNACEITSLKVSGTAITPSGVTYSANVPYTTDKLNIAATFSAGATSDISSIANKPLNEGLNTFNIKVTAEDKVTSKTYTVQVTRANGDTVNTLTKLEFKNGTNTLVAKAEADLGSGGTFAVTDKIEYADRDKLVVDFAKKSNLSTMTAVLKQGGNAVNNNVTASLGTLNAGAYSLEITVKPQRAGSPDNVYIITFEIAAADSDDKLSSLNIAIIDGETEKPVNFTEDFSPETFSYSVTVPKGTQKVKLTGTHGALTTVTGLDEVELTSLPYTHKITVTAQSGAKTEYTVIITAEKDLSGLTLSNLTVVGFTDNGTEYNLVYEELVKDYRYKIVIPNDYKITWIQIRADDVDQYTIEGRGKVPFGIDKEELTQYVQFIKNTIVERSISFEFLRESDVNTLEKLYFNDVEIEINNNDLFFEVDESVTTVKVLAVATHPHATVRVIAPVTGTVTANEQSIELIDGTTVIVIRVKATDGKSEGVYTLSVKRNVTPIVPEPPAPEDPTTELPVGEVVEKTNLTPFVIGISVSSSVSVIAVIVLIVLAVKYRRRA